MFDKVSRLAERAAVGLSRRAFLTRIGRIGVGAMAFAAFVGEAAAGDPNCVYLGGCCGGACPYYRPAKGSNLGACYSDPKCHVGSCGACFASPACCGGTGSCNFGTTCYSDGGCDFPC
jgi:hypothetical protein